MNRLLLVLAISLSAPAAADPIPYDIVVYGGTSGGVIAAVQSAKTGKSVVLIPPTTHLGGLTTSGLGWTDLGKSSILGGLSREFHHRIYPHHPDDMAWKWQTRASYGNSGQGGPAFNATTEIASVFEPKVAAAVFAQLIAGESVPLVTGRLDLENGVVMDGGKISHLRLEDGREFSDRIFIDASYEGDLLPGAGVTFTTGREANAVHGETFSGIQSARATKNQLRDGIDPYVVPGEPASVLLPGVNADSGGADGAGDDRLQGQTSGFYKLGLMPNRKTDSNNTGGISTDFIGMNYGADWDWTTLDHDQRLALAKDHENCQRGLIWNLQNHPRVPLSIRNAHAAWASPPTNSPTTGTGPISCTSARRGAWSPTT